MIETAREMGSRHSLIPASSGGDVSISAQLIRNGAIGRLREIHNWSNRPVWPQYPERRRRRRCPKIGLGAVARSARDCPYHPHYTHTVFRGWYEFGGGAI